MGARVECSQGGGGSSRAALTQENTALRPPPQVALLSQVSFFPTTFNQQHFLQLIKVKLLWKSPLLFKLPRASQSSNFFLLFSKDHLNSQLFKYSTCNFRYHLSPCWKCKFLGPTHTLTKSESLGLEVSNLCFNRQVILNTCSSLRSTDLANLSRSGFSIVYPFSTTEWKP